MNKLTGHQITQDTLAVDFLFFSDELERQRIEAQNNPQGRPPMVDLAQFGRGR